MAWCWLTAPAPSLFSSIPCSTIPPARSIPLQILGQLVTEKVRTLGAQLVNANGEQFIMPLEPRDVVTSAIIRECRERQLGLKDAQRR